MDKSLTVPYYLLSQQNYLLSYDENDNPFMTFDTSENNEFPTSDTYSPPTGAAYLVLDLNPNSTAQPTSYYLIYNLQMQVYQVCGTNLDEVEAYDFAIQVNNLVGSSTRFTWSEVSGASNYILFPNSLTWIPVNPFT